MVRRLPHVVALVAIASLMLPTAAAADQPSRLVSPENGTVTGPLEIRFEFEDARVREVRVRPASGGESRSMTCEEPCPRNATRTVAFTLEPGTGAPFAEKPLPNGPLNVELVGSRELGDDISLGVHTLRLRVPSAGVRGLAPTVEDRTVRLAWKLAPEPDIERYRVERCGGVCEDGGRWEALRDVPASASSYNDEPGAGEFSYRVVTIRSTGGDGSLETVSSSVAATVTAPADGNGNGNGNGDGTGNGDGNGDDAPAEDRDAGNGERRERSQPPRLDTRERSRSGDAPSLSVDRSDAPGVPEVADKFEPELDYSGMDARDRAGTDTDGTPDTEIDDEVIVGAPGDGEGTFLGALTDPDRVAVPIAGGLLMTAIALHLWRWQKLPIP